MVHSILSETDLTSIDSWISNLKHHQIKDRETRMKVIIQAINTLNFHYKHIGNGSTRIVFDLDNGFVLKIAISYSGIVANEREIINYTHNPEDLRKHLCPIKDFGHGWIIMKKIESTLPKDEKYKKKVLELETKFINYGIKPEDLWRKNGHPKIKNLAISEEGEIMVIDYGSFKGANLKKKK